jgi:hypothetical protein
MDAKFRSRRAAPAVRVVAGGTSERACRWPSCTDATRDTARGYHAESFERGLHCRTHKQEKARLVCTRGRRTSAASTAQIVERDLVAAVVSTLGDRHVLVLQEV